MKIADIVVLKSGSVLMVVQEIRGTVVECVWFANGLSHCAEFRVEILILAALANQLQILER